MESTVTTTVIIILEWRDEELLVNYLDSFAGNGWIEHHKDAFRDWAPAPWVSHLGMDKYFHMNSEGVLTVREPGLYYVYAQVMRSYRPHYG